MFLEKPNKRRKNNVDKKNKNDDEIYSKKGRKPASN